MVVMKLPHLVTLVVIAGEMHQSKAHYFDRGLFASVSIHFPTLRRHENNGFRDVSLGKLGQKTRD